ncbi:Na(+)-translocating NADH-quinone reductase subunit F [Snuella lapsa]|uniref:Na(+)-translocating NADH-quinone reductase subunit F n=1 Tax=Snuella lapsa TaxID=870481 RepID=A0ABP6Y8S8_9FLAO
MKTSIRLEQAVQKLYVAFHSNKLNPECCKQCAVGNILDNTESWKYLSDRHGSLKLNYVGIVNQNLGRKFNGYTPQELLHIEAIFLKACGYSLPLHYRGTRPTHPEDKDLLFKGLCAVIAYLCKLDGISNVMDYTKLFKTHSKRQNTLQQYFSTT